LFTLGNALNHVHSSIKGVRKTAPMMSSDWSDLNA
jgi:hypothetical protein